MAWRDRLETLMKEKGFSMKRLSLSAGLGETFVRDVLKRGHMPAMESIRKLAIALEVPLAALISQESSVSRTSAKLKRATIVGAVRAGEWLDQEFSLKILGDEEDAEFISVFDHPKARAEDQVVFKVVGDSMDELCPAGGYAIAIPYERAAIELKSGLIVVAERELHGMFELTIKELEKANGHWRLKPRSSNPKYSTITFPSVDEDERVRIVAIVIRFTGPDLL